MRPARLTREECQVIADRTSSSLDELSGMEALRSYQAHTQEVLVDEATGKPYRCRIYAHEINDQVWLAVSIFVEPQIVRHAERLKVIAGFIEGWQNAPASAHKLLALDRADSS